MKLLLFLLFFAVTVAQGAFESLARGSASIAMGGIAVALADNPWAAFGNPGALGVQNTRSLSLFYSPQPFGLKELSHGSFSYIEPVSFGSFALSGSRFGFALYRELDFQLSFGSSLTDIVSIGGTVHYYSLTIERYGSASSLGADIGILTRLAEEIHWGFAATNINVPTLGSAREKLPQVFTTGVAYAPHPDVTLALDFVKDVRYPLELRAGAQYLLLNTLALRAGTTQEPSMLSGGIGLVLPFVTVDYAYTGHSELGSSHQFSLSLFIGEP
jgi:hypothetical protein